jgi:3-hydroxyisobutyrate dehydrogenase-like beta-hydroxyacid dehydrogenase
MASHNFQGKAPTSHLTKDTRLILELAMENHLPLFMTNMANQIFQVAEAHGLGEVDMASVIQVFENLAGKSLTKKI